MLEKAGVIWDFRLMMDPLSGQNRGYGFASFTTRDAAQECVKQVSRCYTNIFFLDIITIGFE